MVEGMNRFSGEKIGIVVSDEFRTNVLEIIGAWTYSHGPFFDVGQDIPAWSRAGLAAAAQKAIPEYLPILLDALMGTPDGEAIQSMFNCDMDEYERNIGIYLYEWSKREPDFVLSAVFTCLRDNLAKPCRSTIVNAIAEITHPHVPRYVDDKIIDYDGYTEDDRIWLSNGIGASLGIGAEKILQRLLDNTPDTMPEARGETITYLKWVQQHGEIAELEQ